ncbi:MAG: hypothetical protein ACKVQW_07330 [Pyrinomonadaceae bacterium]
MFESWFQVLNLILAGVLLAAVGYLISEIRASRRNRKKNDELRGKTESLEKILRKVEDKVGITVRSEFFSPHVILRLQDIQNRLDNVFKRLNQPKSDSHKIDLGQEINATGERFLSDTDESTREEEDDKNWEAYERWNKRPEAESPVDQTNIKKQLTELYNEAIGKRELRDALWQQFQITQIENINAVEQRLGNTIKPEFRQSESGNFYAVDNPTERKFLVVPKFDLTVKQTNYESTIKFVFECRGFDEVSSYSQVRVLHPAVFVKNGDTWELDKKGELLLSQ